MFQPEIRFVSNGKPFKIFQLPNDHVNSNAVKFTTSKTASEVTLGVLLTQTWSEWQGKTWTISGSSRWLAFVAPCYLSCSFSWFQLKSRWMYSKRKSSTEIHLKSQHLVQRIILWRLLRRTKTEKLIKKTPAKMTELITQMKRLSL